ncbi:MAG: RagB/SusD family nutrient uptake outer membrane protein, partial [Tannerellaceae bacterium]|nr:RagB/SusD family nutrient uptake outer membrane protein [Tannerellaceae bacterium]
MKQKFLYIIMLLVVLMSGCQDDFLETKSTSQVNEDAIFTNTQTAMLAVNGLHKLMWIGNAQSTLQDGSNSAFYGGYDMLMIWYEMLGDDLIFTYHNAQFYLQAAWTGHRNITAGSQAHFYRLLQYFVANSNMILEKVDDIPGTESEKDNLKGQAHFYRAFGYYTMVQMYAERYRRGENNSQLGIVLRNDASLEPRARATVEEVYKQINADADEAIRLLSETGEKRPNKSHIDQHIARGLKARILLTQGKWQEAAEMAKLVVEKSGAQLQDDTYTTTENRFSDNANKEWLWGSNATLTPYVQLTHFHGYMSNEIVSYNQNSPRAINSLLYKKISDTDVRKGVWFPQGGVKSVTPRPIVPPHTNSKYA